MHQLPHGGDRAAAPGRYIFGVTGRVLSAVAIDRRGGWPLRAGVQAQDFAGEHDLRQMQRLTQQAWTLAGPKAAHHIGGLAWSHSHIAGREPQMRRRLWQDRGRVVAWGGCSCRVSWNGRCIQTGPNCSGRYWTGSNGSPKVTGGRHRCWPRTARLTEILTGRGYLEGPAAPFFAFLLRDLASVGEPPVPAGYRLRTVTADDLDRRVEVHRGAWAPSRLSAGSYRAVRQTWPYRQSLDCVVEAPRVVRRLGARSL